MCSWARPVSNPSNWGSLINCAGEHSLDMKSKWVFLQTTPKSKLRPILNESGFLAIISSKVPSQQRVSSCLITHYWCRDRGMLPAYLSLVGGPKDVIPSPISTEKVVCHSPIRMNEWGGVKRGGRRTPGPLSPWEWHRGALMEGHKEGTWYALLGIP